jgi:hypothetical protein
MYPQDIFAAVSSTSPRDVSFVVVVFWFTKVCMIPTKHPGTGFLQVLFPPVA